MAKFVKLDDGDYVNVDCIRCIMGLEEPYHAILNNHGNAVKLTKKDLYEVLKASEEQ